MILLNKRRHKPFYKQFLKLRKNVQNRIKIFKFNKQKWKRFQQYSRKQLKFYKRFKLKDPFKLTVSKFASRGNSFQQNFRINLTRKKIFNLFYGGLKSKILNNKLREFRQKTSNSSNFQNFSYDVIQHFESRLDVVLYRAKFCLSIKSARQFIFHGHVLVNKCVVKTPSYILRTDDLIEIAWNIRPRNLVKQNIMSSNFWPLSPKYLVINYNTLQIIFLYDKNKNFLPLFSHQLVF